MLPQPMICVADVVQSSAWYQRTLGFASAHGGPEYEQLMSGGVLALQLHRWDVAEHPHLGDPAAKPYGNGVALWFTAEQIEADFDRAVRAEAEMLEPLHVNPLANHLEFWLRDPDGYLVVVASPYGYLGQFAHSSGQAEPPKTSA